MMLILFLLWAFGMIIILIGLYYASRSFHKRQLRKMGLSEKEIEEKL